MKNRRYIIAGIFVLALFLRIGLLFVYHGGGVAEQQDARDYTAIAHNLIEGNGFTGLNGEPTQIRPPGYPVFLAAVYSAFGESTTAVKIVQDILSALTVLLILLLTIRLFGPGIGVLAGVLIACYPPFIIYSNIALSETLFTFLLAAFALQLQKAYTGSTIKAWVLLGIIQGLQTLVRPTTLLLPAAVFLLIALVENKKRFLKGFLIFFIISYSIVSIWTVRNWREFHSFIPVSATGGYGLWFSTLDNALIGEKVAEPDFLAQYPQLNGLARYRQDAFLKERAKEYIHSHKREFARKMARNLMFLFTQPVGKVVMARSHPFIAGVLQAAQYIFLAGCCLGIIISIRSYAATMVPLLLLVYMTVLHCVVIPLPRYRLPFEPFMLLFVAVGINYFYKKGVL